MRNLKFRIRTGVPRGKGSWAPNTAMKVQTGLFEIVAMLAAEDPDVEARLMAAIAAAKENKAAAAA